MTLTKKELIHLLVRQHKMSMSQATFFVGAFFDEIVQTLIGGEDVKCSGLGHFTVRNKRARPGRNPKTKEDYMISARKVVTFKASPRLQSRINASLGSE